MAAEPDAKEPVKETRPQASIFCTSGTSRAYHQSSILSLQKLTNRQVLPVITEFQSEWRFDMGNPVANVDGGSGTYKYAHGWQTFTRIAYSSTRRPLLSHMPFPCSSCQKQFETVQGKRQHQRAVHAIYKCKLCHKGSYIERGLADHYKSKHPKRLQKDFFSCAPCRRYYFEEQSWIEHCDQNSDVHPICTGCHQHTYDPLHKNSPLPHLNPCDQCIETALARRLERASLTAPVSGVGGKEWVVQEEGTAPES
ncbi:hypothetical protein BDW22DRAFT_289996 [Trametopsis cervina]|nr:hypothetical protein BDW22DRAFT_289996 [Trametopsis cervina]